MIGERQNSLSLDAAYWSPGADTFIGGGSMNIGSGATQITEEKVRLPINGIAYMLTTGDEPLSNMETFYVGMTENPTCASYLGTHYCSLRLLRKASFIDSIHNVELSHIIPGVVADNGTGYDLSTLKGILSDVIIGWSVKGQEWKFCSFQIRSGRLVFKLIPKNATSANKALEVSCELDHLSGQVLQFGLEVFYPRWQFWRHEQIVNIVCDMTNLPRVLKIAATTYEDGKWQEVRRIIYEAEFRKGEEHTCDSRRFYNGRVEITRRAAPR